MLRVAVRFMRQNSQGTGGTEEPMTKCKLCHKMGPLKKSHIFGRAGFERMRRAGGNTQGVFIDMVGAYGEGDTANGLERRTTLR